MTPVFIRLNGLPKAKGARHLKMTRPLSFGQPIQTNKDRCHEHESVMQSKKERNISERSPENIVSLTCALGERNT